MDRLQYARIKATHYSAFVESQHPRDDNGKFSEIQGTHFSGSHEPIEEFNDGSYLTPDKGIAGQYGQYVSSAKINVKNVLRPQTISDIAEASGIEPLEENRFVFEELDRKKVREALREKGYEAVEFEDVAPNSPGDKTHKAVFVFSGKHIQKIDE